MFVLIFKHCELKIAQSEKVVWSQGLLMVSAFESQFVLKSAFEESLDNPQNNLSFFHTGLTGEEVGIHPGELTIPS